MKSKLLLAGSILASGLLITSCQSSGDVVYDGTDLEPAGNPIFTDAWTADPAPLVVGDRVYVYTGEVHPGFSPVAVSGAYASLRCAGFSGCGPWA